MSDLVFAVVQLTYDSGKGVTALPTMTFDISNSISNPGEVWQDYMTNTRYGAGILAANLDTDSATGSTSTSLKSISNQVPANQFNNDGSTSTQVRYTINGVLNTGDTVKNNIDRINLASSSWTTYDHKEGKWRVVVNRAATAGELASAFEFTDDNIIGEINLSSTSLEDLYNSVEVAFANRNARDQSDYYRASVSSALRNNLEPDNQLRMRLDLVNNGIQAGRIGLIELMQSRYDLVISFTADYSALVCEVGDVVKVTNPIYDFTEKLFRITRVRETEGPQGELAVEITALQYDSGVYTDEQQDDAPDEPISGIPPSSQVPPPINTTATISIDTLDIVLTCTIPTNSFPINRLDWFYLDEDLNPGGTYDYLFSHYATTGSNFQPGETVDAFNTAINLLQNNYTFKVKSQAGQYLSNLSTATAIFFNQYGSSAGVAQDANNLFIGSTTPGTEFYVASASDIGTYTAVVADTQLKYVVDSNSSGTLYTSALNIDNTLTWNTYVIGQPTGSTSTFLRNDGQWATPAGGGTTTTWATLGDKTGSNGPNQIGLGYLAGGTNTGTIAIGSGAGASTQSQYAIAIGFDAGNTNQGEDGISIGRNAGQSNQGANSIAIGGQTGLGMTSAGQTNQGTNAVAIGVAAAHTNQGSASIALGNFAAGTTQGTGSIAIGNTAGQNTQSNYSVAIGYSAARYNQGGYAVAIGYYAGNASQSTGSIIISAGATALQTATNAGLYISPILPSTSTQVLYYDTSTKEVTYGDLSSLPVSVSWANITNKTGASGPTSIGLGQNAGGTNTNTIAIGVGAGQTTQGSSSVAIGDTAAYINQGSNAVAIGSSAGISNQGTNAIAIGASAASAISQGIGAIAIGKSAGTTAQGDYAIALGFESAVNNQNPYSVAIGYKAGTTSQSTGSIIISAGATALQTATNAGLYISPILPSTSTQVLYYNTATKEVTYGAAASSGITQAQAEDIAIIYAIALGG
jgi:hypothetical protein